MLAAAACANAQDRGGIERVSPVSHQRNKIARLMGEKRFGEAIVALESLCDSLPEHHDLAEMLSTCYLREGRSEEAAALLEDRIGKVPGRTGFVRNLGLAYLNLGRQDDALRAWRSLLGGESKAENYGTVAEMEWGAGMYELAIGTLKDGARFERYFVPYTMEIIRLERLKGDSEAAFMEGLRIAEKEKNPYGGTTGFLHEIFMEAGERDGLLAKVDSLSFGAKANRMYFTLMSALLRARTGDFSLAADFICGERKLDLEPEEMYYFASVLLEMRDQRGAEGYADIFLKLIDAFIEKHGRSPMVPQMMLIAARYSCETGEERGPDGAADFEKALGLVDRILANRGAAAYREKASLLKSRILLEKLRDPEGALAALDAVAWTSPADRGEAEELRMRSLLAARRWDEAKKGSSSVKSPADSAVAALNGYGAAMAAFLSGDFAAAVDSLSTMAKRYPWSEWANDALETAVTAKLSLDEGGAGLGRYVDALNDVAQGRFTEALAAIDAVESEASGSALLTRAIYMKSEILLELGRTAGAKAGFETVAEKYPLDRFAPKALERLGMMAEAEDPAGASAFYGRIIDEHPGYLFMERVRTRYMELRKKIMDPRKSEGESAGERGGGVQ